MYAAIDPRKADQQRIAPPPGAHLRKERRENDGKDGAIHGVVTGERPAAGTDELAGLLKNNVWTRTLNDLFEKLVTQLICQCNATNEYRCTDDQTPTITVPCSISTIEQIADAQQINRQPIFCCCKYRKQEIEHSIRNAMIDNEKRLDVP